jgi:hypothetical protein
MAQSRGALVRAAACTSRQEAVTVVASLREAGHRYYEPASRISYRRSYRLGSIIGSRSLRPTDLLTEVSNKQKLCH